MENTELQIQEQPKLEVTPVDKMTQELAKENVTDRLIAEMDEKYSVLTIAGIEDKDGYKAVHEARMNCKNTRVLASKICKAGREDAIKEQKAWIEKEKEVTGKIEVIEKRLQEKQDAIDAEKERIKKEKEEAEQVRVQSLVTTLTELGCSFNGVMFAIGNISPISYEGIKHMSVEMWNELVSEVTTEAKRLADAQAAEEARIQAEKEEQERLQREEQERIQAEREELQKQREEQDRERRELEAQKQKLEQERLEVQKKKTDKRCSDLAALGMGYDFGEDAYIFDKQVYVPTVDITTTEDAEWNAILEKITPAIADIKAENEKQRLEEIEEGKRQAAEAERQRIASEQKAEQDRKDAEEAERQRQESLKPDKEKLLSLGNTLVQIPLPELSTEAGKAINTEVQELLNKVQMHIVKRVKSL